MYIDIERSTDEEAERKTEQGQEARDLVKEVRELFAPYQRGNRSVDMTTKSFLLLRELSSETDRMRAALEAVTHIAGNLTDEAVEAVGGVNDARSRALMVVTARQIAKNALNPKN